MSYDQVNAKGDVTYRFHTDRTLCDDSACPCDLPSTANQAAIDMADQRDDWLVGVAMSLLGPFSKAQARAEIDRLVAKGCKPRLLRVVEDYTG